MNQALFQHMSPVQRSWGGEDTERVSKIRTEFRGDRPLRDGAVALLGHFLQQPWRRNLLAEEVPGVGDQPEVAIDKRHEGQRGGQPRELRLLC